jgi:predicted RecB family nuclease
LHLDITDPREAVAKSLCDGFGELGSVVAYNKQFENSVLRALGDEFPKYRKRLVGIADRLVDPWPLLVSAVYDPKFLGSYSLKSVAPALFGNHMSYEGLDIGEGRGASRGFLDLIKGKQTEGERKKLISAMLNYCRQDTMATVELISWLFKNMEEPLEG